MRVEYYLREIAIFSHETMDCFTSFLVQIFLNFVDLWLEFNPFATSSSHMLEKEHRLRLTIRVALIVFIKKKIDVKNKIFMLHL